MYQSVLITGAAGRLGQVLREGLRGSYPLIRLSDRTDLGEAFPGEELVTADLASFEDMDAAMQQLREDRAQGFGQDPETRDMLYYMGTSFAEETIEWRRPR